LEILIAKNIKRGKQNLDVSAKLRDIYYCMILKKLCKGEATRVNGLG